MSPYPLREGLGVVWRNLFADSRNPLGLEFCARHVALLPGARAELRVGFLGDVMDIDGRPLEIDASVCGFFSDCDAVVGNLEAVIAPAKSHHQQQRHEPAVLDSLRRMFGRGDFCLSVANNHAADYGPRVLSDTVARLRDSGFRPFGTRETPFVDLGERMRVSTGSMWTNMPCTDIADFDDLPSHRDPGRFNVYYPHWGYEMECSPRPGILELGQNLLAGAGAIVGHHSHLPQPVRFCRVGGEEKLLATSLGNFCCRRRRFGDAAYRYGIVLKLALGRRPSGETGLAALDWSFVESANVARGARVALRETIPFFPSLRAGLSGENIA